MKPKETFYILTNEGLVKMDILQKFIYIDRVFVLTRCFIDKNKVTVTDYMTGMEICSGNNKEYLIRKAKKKILKNKIFDYSKLWQGNSDGFLDGYFSTMQSLEQRGNRAEGIRFAMEVFNNK